MLLPSPPGGVRIGMWGGTSSGKTAYLAALGLAALDPENPDLRLTSEEEGSDAFLTPATNDLYRDRTFPDATTAPAEYRWRLQGRPSAATQERATGGGVSIRRRVDLRLRVMDMRGAAFGADDVDPGVSEQREEVIEYLAAAQGILYVFDPTKDNGIDYFATVMHPLRRKVEALGRLRRGGRLPHAIAVCMTKFDDPRVFDRALDRGLVQQDPGGVGMPRVPRDWASRLFAALAEQDGNRLLREAIARHFEPERVACFATSAVGFLHRQGGEVDLSRYVNVNYVGGKRVIVGGLTPINVLEPLIWLDRTIQQYP